MHLGTNRSDSGTVAGAGRKSCAITTARRLGDFLGDERIKDKGLNCNYVVSRLPEGSPTSERAVPVAIFATEPAIARAFLRKWCGDICGGATSSFTQPLSLIDPPATLCSVGVQGS
jgi:hypothetical protein